MRLHLILALVLAMALIPPVFGEMESQKCGPYLVTFNLTTDEKMNFSQMKPIYYNNNVLYGLNLTNQNGDECGSIGICTFYQPATSFISLDDLALFIETSYKNMNYSQISKNQRTIDGHLGFVVAGVDPSGDLKWKADYWLVNGGTEVEVQGNHGWIMENVITMLESIRVERVGF